jgi:hypothetical protein
LRGAAGPGLPFGAAEGRSANPWEARRPGAQIDPVAELFFVNCNNVGVGHAGLLHLEDFCLGGYAKTTAALGHGAGDMCEPTRSTSLFSICGVWLAAAKTTDDHFAAQIIPQICLVQRE